MDQQPKIQAKLFCFILHEYGYGYVPRKSTLFPKFHIRNSGFTHRSGRQVHYSFNTPSYQVKTTKNGSVTINLRFAVLFCVLQKCKKLYACAELVDEVRVRYEFLFFMVLVGFKPLHTISTIIWAGRGPNIYNESKP